MNSCLSISAVLAASTEDGGGWGGASGAIGFDANAAEIEHLARREGSASVTYLHALAAIDHEHPFAQKKRGQPDCQRNAWPRTSAKQYAELVHAERTAPPAGAGRSVVVPEYLKQNDVKSLDFLKIDVDGKDFDVLNSFDQALSGLAVLGVGVEVNFCGSDCETDNTFHNTDRFLKARGFELLTLSTRRYSVGALPSRFLGGAAPRRRVESCKGTPCTRATWRAASTTTLQTPSARTSS